MITRIVLIAAAPTPWDAEDRLVGMRPLPLTAEAIDSINRLLDGLLDPISGLPERIAGIYRPAANEACDQAARLVAQRYNLRVRSSPDLEGLNLGLWEGLAHEELRQRYPTTFQEWEENPLGVVPPEGEPLQEAVDRVHIGLQRILQRNRGTTVAIIVRPRVLQIASGLLRGENTEQIAHHLHQSQRLVTIEMDFPALQLFVR